MRATFFYAPAILCVLALQTYAQRKPWSAMDYGPTLSTTIESAYPARNITQKAIAVRLDEKSQTYVLFDEDLFRYSLASTGSLIDFHSVLYDGEHRVWPKASGDPIFGTGLTPGWAKAGSFEDPRTRYKSTDYTKESPEWQNRPYGPLPHQHAQYKGLYQNAQRTIFSYTVSSVPILDSPSLEAPGVIARTINIAKSQADLDLLILEHPSPTARVSPIDNPLFSQRNTQATNTFAIIGDDQRSVAAALINPPTAATYAFASSTQLRLHIPAASTPANFKILIATTTTKTLNDFLTTVKSAKPPEDLSTFTQAGPSRYPQILETKGQLAPPSDNPYVIDTLTPPTDNPFKARLRFSGFDFFPDGHTAAISTWDGDVWKVTGIDEKLDHLKWQRIATGLYQPLGLKILQSEIGNPQSAIVYVNCRDQIVRLHDTNNDGETDLYECFNNDHQVTEHFHEFAMGLQADAQGNFYYAKSARHALEAIVPQHGTIIKVSADGSKSEILASGFRAANGIGLSPKGELACTDQEGYWTPANRINLFTPPTQDSALSTQHSPRPFFGNLWSYLSTPRTPQDGYDPPLCWLPVNVDRSPAEDLWIPNDQWGLPKGQMLHTSYGTGKLFTIVYETNGAVSQGGAVEIPGLVFRTGIMRARFNPADNQLYVCGLVGWATNCADPGAFHRIRYTGKPVNLPTHIEVQKDTIKITFNTPLDKTAAQDLSNYAIQQWNYRWTKNYGSKHYKVSDPKKEGQDEVELAQATLSPDQKTIALKIPSLAPVMQMKIQLNLKTAQGQPLRTTIHNTINQIPN